MASRSLILGGGNALGCYLAGAYEALHAAGEEPDWVAGTSIGAVTAGLIVGNPPERRLERLRAYWSQAAAPNWLPWQRAAQRMGALQTRLAGRPAMFHPRLPNLSGQPERVGMYDVAPMRRTLEELIDFDRLNSGAVRLSVVAVDLETGAEVVFNTATTRITVDHLMASAALIPDFPPARIGERWLVDGGLAANVPVDPVLGPEAAEDMLCFLVDLFPIQAPAPRDLAGMAMRQTDLTFACQTERSLRAVAALDATGPPKRPRVDVIRTSYAANASETLMKSWDFSQAALTRRWDSGRADMHATLRRFRSLPPGGAGVTSHPITRASPDTAHR
jgi:NTE family protein